MAKTKKILKSLRGKKRIQFGHAALVGICVGLVAVLFQICLKQIFSLTNHLLSWCQSMKYGIFVFALFCSLCAWSAVTITKKYCPEASGSGIPQVKGVLIRLGNIRWLRVLWVKFIGGLMVIGTGFTLGREGPTVHLGAAIGLGLTKLLHLPSKLRLHYVACGAGAGLAAAFNAPLAGFVFVIEELRKELSALTYGTALVATVLADVVTRIILGTRPSLKIPIASNQNLLSLKIIPVTILIGIAAGILATLYNKVLLKSVRFTTNNNDSPLIKHRALIIGFLVGIISFLIPLSMGSGNIIFKEFFQTTPTFQPTILFIVSLLALKFFLNIICYIMSAPGGIFTPMLAIGALLGYSLALLATGIFPDIPYQAWAILAMASFFSGVVQAPLTGVILTYEMTAGYDLLFALLVSSMLAYFTAQILGGRPIYEALLRASLSTDKENLKLLNEPELLDLVIEPQSFMDGKRIVDLQLPREVLIMTITRGGEALLPHGDVRLYAGDQLTLAIAGSAEEIPEKISKLATN